MSARNDSNVQKMLYSSVAELPFFESFKTEQAVDLVGELEMENNDTKLNASSMIDSSRNDIQIKNASILENGKNNIKSKCKC